MNIPELQIKVADALGVSNSQKELAFEIFIDTVASILTEGITLKVHCIGFFQIKNDSTKAGDNKSLVFSSLPEDFTKEDKNLFLTIDVLQKSNTASEYDSNVFSIGVGKPLLPLVMDELPDSETSYAMLRKSIEERVKELISDSDQIPNFNIWDDYNKEDSEKGKQFPYTQSDNNVKNTGVDFILPGLGRSDASKSNENNKLLNTLIVDIPDFNQQDEKNEENRHHNSELSEPKEIQDDYVVINGVNPLPNGITIDDLLDDSDPDNKVGNVESVEFEIPDSDLSKIFVEDSLVTIPKTDNSDDKPSEETISINDFLDNSNSKEETIDLNEYLNNKLNNESEKQISLKDLGLDRESLGKTILPPEEDIVLSFNEKDFYKFGDESGEQSNTNEISYFETDKENAKSYEAEQQDGKIKEDIEEDNERIEKSIYEFTIEINDKNDLIEDPFDDLIASSKKANEFEIKQLDNIKVDKNEKKETYHESFSEIEVKNDIDDSQVKTELITEEFESYNTKYTNELKSKDSDSFEHKNVEDTSEELKSNSAGEFEIIDWPDPMEINNNERIEWNWGDELKEEFGLGSIETEDISFEEVDDSIIDDELSIGEDDIEEKDNLKKDLFSRLERTLEHEVTSLREIDDEVEKQESSKNDIVPKFDKTVENEYSSLHVLDNDFKTPEIQKQKITDEITKDNLIDQEIKLDRKTKGDILIKNDEKVFLEFHGPPPKYQFVEDKSPLNEKRMAITLSPEYFEEFRQESSQRITREINKNSGTLPEPIGKELSNKELDPDSASHPKRDYIKTFSIFISTFIVVGIVVVFFFLRSSGRSNQPTYNKPSQQESEQKAAPVESQTSNNSQEIQSQTNPKINSNLNLDESSDFPAGATPPVPIKDQATDMTVSSTPNKENRSAINKSNSEIKPEQEKVEKFEDKNGLYKTFTTDTRVNNSIYYDGKSYNLQVSSWRDKLKSETEVKRLRALGMNAFIVEAYLPQKGGKWFRVRVGPFNSEKQAEEYKTKNNL